MGFSPGPAGWPAPRKSPQALLHFSLRVDATVRGMCEEHDEMRDKRLAVIGAQHARRAVFRRAAPGKHPWRFAAHVARRRRLAVGARYTCRADSWRVVPGVQAWRRVFHERITLNRRRNANHAAPFATTKLPQITRHTMPSNFLCNSMKTKDRVPRKVTHFYSPEHLDVFSLSRTSPMTDFSPPRPA